MMNSIKTILLAAGILITASCVHMKDDLPPLQVVQHVDLSRYTGIWYEIARYPNSFQKGCVGSRATYAMSDDGSISVVNECNEASDPAKIRSAKGKALVVDKETNAKLKVSFFRPFYGAYWIIDLGSDYEYAVIGHPERKYLWILSRTREMEDAVYEGIIGRLKEQHYDTSKLIRESAALPR